LKAVDEVTPTIEGVLLLDVLLSTSMDDDIAGLLERWC